MLFIELTLSCWTLYALREFGKGRKVGAVMALIAYVGWISMWLYTEQYGFIPIDLGLMFVYWERLLILLRGGSEWVE